MVAVVLLLQEKVLGRSSTYNHTIHRPSQCQMVLIICPRFHMPKSITWQARRVRVGIDIFSVASSYHNMYRIPLHPEKQDVVTMCRV